MWLRVLLASLDRPAFASGSKTNSSPPSLIEDQPVCQQRDDALADAIQSTKAALSFS